MIRNLQPSQPASRRLALVGEAPGEQEVWKGLPFVGPAGWRLRSLLLGAGLDMDTCFIGNVCLQRPPDNKLAAFAWDGPEIQEGLAQLRQDLEVFDPHMVVCLGNAALRAFSGEPRSITGWRGSLFSSDFLGKPVKCMATFHPAALLHQAKQKSAGGGKLHKILPLVRFDLLRVKEELAIDGLGHLPQPQVHVLRDPGEVCAYLTDLRSKSLVACDIEGGVGTWSCIGFCAWDWEAVVVPIRELPPMTQDQVVGCVRDLLQSGVPTCWHNALYDTFVLEYGYRIHVENVAQDTMLKWWECYPELDKGLDTLGSVLTKQPYWGSYGDYKDDSEAMFHYCGVDCCVTFAACQELEQRL